MTYSIVARDPDTGELGVGVQTHQPCVGAIVPWVRAGVGAIATQSFVNASYGPQALALLEHGLASEAALAAILAGDSTPAVRQVAVMDAQGNVATHTGGGCIPFAGHQTGEGYSVQANMMAKNTVPAAMATAFEAASGTLPERILAALEAAQAEGGDIRGSQSAAILVRKSNLAEDYQWDLRVDNDPEPLAKLRELVNIRLASRLLRLFEAGAETMATDLEERIRMEEAAFAKAQELAPSDEQLFWFAATRLAPFGATPRAMELLGPLFERAPQWRELLARMEMPGLDELKAAINA